MSHYSISPILNKNRVFILQKASEEIEEILLN